MKRSQFAGERFDVCDTSNAALAASMFSASVGMIWDFATGHVSAFDRMLSDLSEDVRRDGVISASDVSPSRPRFAGEADADIQALPSIP